MGQLAKHLWVLLLLEKYNWASVVIGELWSLRCIGGRMIPRVRWGRDRDVKELISYAWWVSMVDVILIEIETMYHHSHRPITVMDNMTERRLKFEKQRLTGLMLGTS